MSESTKHMKTSAFFVHYSWFNSVTQQGHNHIIVHPALFSSCPKVSLFLSLLCTLHTWTITAHKLACTFISLSFLKDRKFMSRGLDLRFKLPTHHFFSLKVLFFSLFYLWVCVIWFDQKVGGNWTIFVLFWVSQFRDLMGKKFHFFS